MAPENEQTPTEKEPTLQEVMEVAQKASSTAQQALEQSKTKAQTKQAIGETIESEAEDRGISLSDEQIDQISSGVVAEFERRGAFEAGEPAPPQEQVPPTNEVENSEHGSTGTDSNTSQSKTPSNGSESGTENANPDSDEPDNKPRKRSFAERFARGE